MKATIPIGIPPGTKLLHLEWNPEDSSYILWIHHDRSMKYGTYLRLLPNGSIERITLGQDGCESVSKIKEEKQNEYNSTSQQRNNN